MALTRNHSDRRLIRGVASIRSRHANLDSWCVILLSDYQTRFK